MMACIVNRKRFIGLLRARFPEVVADIADCSHGLLHCEMGTLARATQRAISLGDMGTAKRHFLFIDSVFEWADPDVENAINVSYLEHIDFAGVDARRMRARQLLTPRLQGVLEESEEYLAETLNERTGA